MYVRACIPRVYRVRRARVVRVYYACVRAVYWVGRGRVGAGLFPGPVGIPAEYFPGNFRSRGMS